MLPLTNSFHEAGSIAWPVMKCHSRPVFYQRKYLKMKWEIRYGEFLKWKKAIKYSLNTNCKTKTALASGDGWFIVHIRSGYHYITNYPKNQWFKITIVFIVSHDLMGQGLVLLYAIELVVFSWQLSKSGRFEMLPQHVWHLVMFS